MPESFGISHQDNMLDYDTLICNIMTSLENFLMKISKD